MDSYLVSDKSIQEFIRLNILDMKQRRYNHYQILCKYNILSFAYFVFL